MSFLCVTGKERGHKTKMEEKGRSGEVRWQGASMKKKPTRLLLIR